MIQTHELTVAGKSARFQQLDNETFNEALSRGAAKLGYHGGAFAQPNLATNHQVTVTDKPSAPQTSNARQAYNGTVREVNRFTGERPSGRANAAQRC